MKTTKQIGDLHEEQAKQFLVEKDYQFICQNYRSGRNEIDLIFKLDNKFIFVEVKFRKNKKFGNPEDFVDHKKLKRIQEAAENYCFENKWTKNIRFDIIAIAGEEIFHFVDVS
jgi:putative endonuclease